ncbi:MAG: transposase [Bacteroidota bacterium]
MAYKKHKQYRLPGYDYAGAGEYFLTICTKDRRHYFGHVSDGIMHLSVAGEIARNILLMIPEQFENTILDEWVVMPNHVHLILMIDGRNLINQIPTDHKNKSGIPNNPMELPHDTIGKMMRWYKGRVSYDCRKSGMSFAWQSRFHDHIIRNQRALENIRQYIRDNPRKWKGDCFF